MTNTLAITTLRNDITMSVPCVIANRRLNLVVLIPSSTGRDEC
jgi:hypothetical protein